jgi:hypothetical protein
MSYNGKTPINKRSMNDMAFEAYETVRFAFDMIAMASEIHDKALPEGT